MSKKIMKQLLHKHISGSTLLLISLMLVNCLNFIFNAYLGRVLSFEAFGLITLVNAFLYMALILFNGLYATINYQSAYFFGRKSFASGWSFFASTNKKIITFTVIISVLWLVAIPFLDTFFQIHNMLVAFFFTPIIILGSLAASNKGFLQGNFKFATVSFLLIIEALSKLLFAWIFVTVQLASWVYLVIPLSVALSFVLSMVLLPSENYHGDKLTSSTEFPKVFFFAVIITGLSSTAFLTFDLLLVKHFLSPVEAGQYALLSLIGKMVYFLGTLPNALILTFISRDEGMNRDSRTSFYKLFSLALGLSCLAFILIGLWGKDIVPLLFGAKTVVILPYLMTYAAGIALFSLTIIIVSYHLAKKHYLFPILAIFTAVAMAIGITLFHGSIREVTYVIFYSSLVSFGVIGLLHALEMYTNFSFGERWEVVKHV
jgi:O-antigen/teichoic acid export membrane protein